MKKYSFLSEGEIRYNKPDSSISDFVKPKSLFNTSGIGNVNVSIDQDTRDDFSETGNMSPRTVYSRRLQVKLIKQILSKCPSAKAFRDVFKNSPVGSMRRLCAEIDDNTPLGDYINFLRYRIVKWSQRDRLISMALNGLFGAAAGGALGALASYTSVGDLLAPQSLKNGAMIGAGLGGAIGTGVGKFLYDTRDNDSVEDSIL